MSLLDIPGNILLWLCIKDPSYCFSSLNPGFGSTLRFISKLVPVPVCFIKRTALIWVTCSR